MSRHACILLPPDCPYYGLDIPEYGSYSQALSDFLSAMGPWDSILAIHLPQEPLGKTQRPHQASSLLAELGKADKLCPFTAVYPDHSSWLSVLEKVLPLLNQEDSPNTAEVWWFWGDTPFLNPVLSQRLGQMFQDYRADFAFADGYPRGLVPEIVFQQRLVSLYQLAQQHPLNVSRSGVFELIQKDINSFHIETLMSRGDHRLSRLELFGQYRRTHVLVTRFAEKLYPYGTPEHFSDDAYEKIFDEKVLPHRTLPASILLQIAAPCPHSCSYCPYPLIHPGHKSDMTFMDIDKLKTIIRSLQDFMPEGTINLSFLGEPLMHPQIVSCLQFLNDETPYDTLVETTGVGWTPDVLEALLKRPLEKVSFIIGMDTTDPQRYAALGKTGFQVARDFANSLLESWKERIYFQTLRLKGGEDDLLKTYREWEKVTSNIIVQKYDTFAGFLPDHKVVDLQPVKRFPCWHLKRSLAIFLDGTVVQCKEDMKKEFVLGNVFQQSFEDIWNTLQDLYNQHREGHFPSPCKECDEYYTYTF